MSRMVRAQEEQAQEDAAFTCTSTRNNSIYLFCTSYNLNVISVAFRVAIA